MARPSKRGFTLIELLIVIAIIGVLMALLFPAFQQAINMAKKTATKSDVIQIANAMINYQTEYGQWPTNASESPVVVGAFMLDALTAGSTSSNSNPRKINFIEIGSYKKGKSGLTTSGNFVDPWNQNYMVETDTNYDNAISNSLPGTNILRKTVGVWSIGVPKSGSASGSPGYSANTNTNAYIKSWD